MAQSSGSTEKPRRALPPQGSSLNLKRIAGYTTAVLAAAVALYLLGHQAGQYVPRFAAWVAGLGVWGPVVFILGYIVATVAFAPGSVLTLAAGAIFGLLRGTIYTFLGATLGASAAFLVARYGARRAIERKLAGNERFAAIDRAVAGKGFQIVALLRLSPVFPFNLLNYALGLTQVRFLDYLLACFAMLPGTLLYVYYGQAAGSLAAAAGGHYQKGTGYWVTLGVGLLATIAVTTLITRLAGRALRQQLGAAPQETAQ
ncbi:MAG TPA: TVP38/TMEM64 family protein [Thermoanaerobaculia bacterium]|nr:TVP38/TMEM64 family protein [Thermoanaerobaculia bacterium]